MVERYSLVRHRVTAFGQNDVAEEIVVGECRYRGRRPSTTSAIASDDGGAYIRDSQVSYSRCWLLTKVNYETPPVIITDFVLYSTWIALAGSIGIVLPSGGSVSFLYGFIFCVLCNFALAASLGELAAIWPTAGGQYHFVYALCTERWKKSMVREFRHVNLTVLNS